MTESARTNDLHFVSICNGVGVTKDGKAWRFDPSKGRWVRSSMSGSLRRFIRIEVQP